MGNVIVYSTPTCSKCMILKSLLDSKKITYTVEGTIDKIVELAKNLGTNELPILAIYNKNLLNYEYFTGSNAVKYGKEM